MKKTGYGSTFIYRINSKKHDLSSCTYCNVNVACSQYALNKMPEIFSLCWYRIRSLKACLQQLQVIYLFLLTLVAQ